MFLFKNTIYPFGQLPPNNIEYLPILLLIFVSIGLALVILGASYFLSVQKPDVEKTSVYECGFDPYEDSRNIFDIRFYIVAILFVVFDLEAMFLFPWAVSLPYAGSMGFWSMFDFLLELTIGFVYVWKVGALEWT
jgi:NADH:ubiquinone oxidoreductase subunit 3 (subunit A)